MLRLFLAALTLGLVQSSEDVVFNTLAGAGYKDTSDLNGLAYLSLAGGAPILLSGINFASQAGSNTWKFEPLWLEGSEIHGPPMDSDDQMNSNSLAGRLAIVAPGVADLMGQDISLFDGEFLPSGWSDPEEGNSLRFTVKVRNTEDSWDVACSSASKCLFAYSRDYTPTLLDVTPPNVAQGSELHFHINPRGAHTTAVTPEDAPPYRSLHLGQYLIDTEDVIEDTDRLDAWAHNAQYAIMTDGSSQNSTSPRILFYNGLAQNMRGATHCNFAGDDCWHMRVHPRIKTVSWNQGYTTGGQEIHITGVALNGTNVDVQVAGQACEIVEHDLDFITCVTAEADAASTIGYQPGQPGMTQIQTDEDYAEYLVLAPTFEVLHLNSSNPLSGWFKAPATGSYRFHVSCDAACTLEMNTDSPYDSSSISTDIPALETIASRSSGTSWRNYHHLTDDGHSSTWYTLTEGEQYYMSGTTNSEMTVAVEVMPDAAATTEEDETCTCDDTTSDETTTTDDSDARRRLGRRHLTDETTTSEDSSDDTETTCDCSEDTAAEDYYVAPHSGHHYATKSMQQVAMEQTNEPEVWDFMITNPDAGTFVLNLVDLTSDPISVYATSSISADAEAWEVQSAVNGFYSAVWGASVEVVRTLYDASGAELTDAAATAADATSLLYTVTVLKQMDGFSTSNVQATPQGDDDLATNATEASISVTTPARGQMSSPPFNGTYVVTCTDSFGADYTSGEIDFAAGAVTVQRQLQEIPFLVDNVEVLADGRFSYPENGVSWILHFTGLDYEVPACEIGPSQGEYPLTGNTDMDANVTVLRAYAESLWFPAVPLEMLHSDAQTPQILITVDGMAALCLDLNCDFAYTESASLISTQTLDEFETDQIILYGTSLPDADDDVIWFGPTRCSEVSYDASQITCALDDTRVTGEWIADILTVYGLTPNEIATSITIPVSADAVSPSVDVNYLGGDEMIITGDSFGYDIDVISVTYSDGTICDVTSVDMTILSCYNRRFTSGASQTQDVTITINGVSATPLTVTLLAQAEVSLTMDPSSVSPVLKTEVTVYLDTNYPETLDREDFNATLYSNDDETYERVLYVMSVDDAAKSVKIKFPGAVSGSYYLQLSSAQHGRIDSDLLQLDVHGTVTSISPLTGSKYGGALVTITGENFSDEPLDNPVMIGSDYCYVQTTSTTQITCRTDLLTDNASGDQLVVVFLKTSEEAATPGGEDMFFAYAAPTAEVTDLQVTFDEASFAHKVVVTGTGFDDTIELYVDGSLQTLESQDGVTATFNLDSIDAASTTDVEVLTSEGYPEGAEITHSIDVAPALLMIDPAVGSSGGTKLVVLGSGFGTSTTGLNLAADGAELCSSVDIYAYGSFYCYTNAIEVASGATITITLDGSASADSFVASDAVYAQSESIVVTGVALSGTTVTFTGTGFLTDHTGTATLAGIEADAVSVNSATEAVASFSTYGVPASTDVPTLHFTHSLGYALYASVDSSVSFEKVQDVTASTAGLECSFAGGCTYAIEADGLYATLQDSANEIRVCGSPCELVDAESSASYAVCTVAELATTYSIDNYSITSARDLSGEEVFADSDPELLHDSLTVESYTSDLADGCYFGMTFKDGHVAVLDEAKIFIGFLADKTPYVDQLAFQGSNDAWASWEELHLFSEEVHEGWNYIDYRDDGTEKPAYNSYRFYGSASGACRITEFKLHGVEAIDDENSSFACSPKIFIGGDELSTSASLESVSYTAAMTPKLTAISPRYGSVLGGTTVTLTGENFTGSAATVWFDNRECTIDSLSSTEIVCTTDDKPYVPDTPETVIDMEGMGLVATQSLVYRYVSLWSDTETWGGDIPPMEDESVAIPAGQHLLFDIDESPVLNALIVEGSMIFAPSEDADHLRTFDANFIMVQHGYFEAGTEEFPYTSKLQITMHATRYSPAFSIYGNKMIGCRYCQLSMHGIPKVTTWTKLSETAEAGATEISVYGEPDWNVGDHIVIAGTTWWSAYDHEEVVIAAIDGSTITLEEALEHRHLSVAPEFGGVEMPMRAEVGLLTRNVLFRGDPSDSRADLFGAHIMVHSPGDETSTARIHYIELTEAGQAFKLGRYAIHFHMIGTVHGSLVKGNAIHHSYNRAVTTHGVHYFKVEQNVAFDTMGHSFFIEDAIETKCVYDSNLSILTRASNSFLNTDQTPGAFWITNPDNIFINNHMVGSDAYGYWFDMQTTAIGANFDPNICPEFTKLGQFHNNTAHGVRKYGLRIFHALIPKQYPCKATSYDPDYAANGYDDPYWSNPKVPAIFEDFTAWKAGRNGAISERTGEVIFKNFKIADSGIAGIEVSAIEDLHESGRAKVLGGMVIGNSEVNDEDGILGQRTVWGVIGPRTEFMTVDGLAFHNFDFAGSAAVGTCSHCFHPAATDSGGRTLTTTGLIIDDATVPKRIMYQEPFREIIHDLDGTLTGLGPNTWATINYPHVQQPECTISEEVHDGVICDSSVQLRRVSFNQYAPWSLHASKLKFARWDAEIEEPLRANETLLWDFEQDVNHTHFSRLFWRKGPDPSQGWPVALVTGHRYRFHWGEGIDFEQMRVYLDDLIWQEDDLEVEFMTNFTDVRAAINMTTNRGRGDLIANETYNGQLAHRQSGDNVVYNQTEVREFLFMLNAQNKSGRTDFLIEGFRCVWDCEEPVLEICEIDPFPFPWSDPSSWPSGAVPIEGDEAEIPNCKTIEMDIEATPMLKSLTVNGRLQFKNSETESVDRIIHTNWVYVRAGELLIGSEELPYNGNAEIRLYGMANDETLAFSVFTEGGNKVLAIVGLAKLYGQPRDRMSRLRTTALRGDTEIKVDYGLDWKQGDQIVLMPTAMQQDHFDYMTIESYDSTSGIVTLTESLDYYHWGKSQSTENDYSGVDMRGEVVLLSRNVKIVGNDTDWWGGQILVTDNHELLGDVQRSGQLIMDNVEVFNCSQRNTHRSAIRFENSKLKWSSITNTVVWGSQMWSFSAQYSSNINIDSCDFIGSRAIGVGIFESNNVTINNMIAADQRIRDDFDVGGGANTVDKESCVSMCAYFNRGDTACYDNTITNSKAIGCRYAGFVVPGHDCGDSGSSRKFRDNVAHSIDGSGALIFPDVNGDSHALCYEGSHFAAYKNKQHSVGTHFSTEEVRITNIVSIDNQLGISVQNGGGDRDKMLTRVSDSTVYGETDAEDCPDSHNCYCAPKTAYLLQGSNHGSKSFHIDSASSLPLRKVKSYGAFNADTMNERIKFIDFLRNETHCGAHQRLFGLIESSSDHIPVQNFDYVEFENVHNDAMAFIMDPPSKWENLSDCIGFPCTAPSNVVMLFRNSKFEGTTRPDTRDRDFQIIADQPSVSETYDDCEYQESWNAWLCSNDYLGQLVMIADDEDWEDRNVAPVWVTNEATGFSNKLNHQMDHMWDGFYTGQKHKSQFATQLVAEGNYTIEFTSTPFDNMRYMLRADRGQIKVKVHYFNAGSYEVYANGEKVDYTPWDKEAGRQSELTGYRGCGENRYVGVENYLEFIATPYCEIEVRPVDKILCNVRMSWTMAEFYSSGGPTSFIDRVSASLGIHASQMKIVAVYTGSVVVEYEITATDDDNNDSSATQLRSLETQLNALLVSDDGASIFGAPVLSASTNEETQIEDPTYNPAKAAPVVNSTPVEEEEEEEESATITTTDEGVVIKLDETSGSLIGIFGVLGLILVCCFGCGCVTLCYYKVKLAQKEVVTVQKKHAQTQEDKKLDKANASESQLEVDQQYVLPEQLELDIFNQKKRKRQNIVDQVFDVREDSAQKDSDYDSRASVVSRTDLMGLTASKLVHDESQSDLQVMNDGTQPDLKIDITENENFVEAKLK